MELIMFVGIPASGKSTLSEYYRHRGYRILSSDAIRNEMTGGRPAGKLASQERRRVNVAVFEAIRMRAREALKSGQSVVIDATNLNRKKRMGFLAQFSHMDCRKVCALLIAAPQVCAERNSRRSGLAAVPAQAMQDMICQFECPNYWEGWDEIVPYADGKPYRFPMEETMAFSQDNPHHTLTLGGHMQAAGDYCADRGFSDRVERIARCHDMGKLYTKRFANRQGISTQDAHYLGHDNYGAYLYLAEQCCGRVLSDQTFADVLTETNLINCHMFPLVRWKGSASAKEADRLLFGDAFIAEIEALHEADMAAH